MSFGEPLRIIESIAPAREIVPNSSNNPTAVEAFKLVDSGRNFSALNVKPMSLAINHTTNKATYIQGVENGQNTKLLLMEDIFLNTTDDYSVVEPSRVKLRPNETAWEFHNIYAVSPGLDANGLYRVEIFSYDGTRYIPTGIRTGTDGSPLKEEKKNPKAAYWGALVVNNYNLKAAHLDAHGIDMTLVRITG